MDLPVHGANYLKNVLLFPYSDSYTINPKDQTSHLLVYLSLSNIYGAMYKGVPTDV